MAALHFLAAEHQLPDMKIPQAQRLQAKPQMALEML